MLLKPHEIEFLHAFRVRIAQAIANAWRWTCDVDLIKAGAVLTALGTFTLAGLAYRQADISQGQLEEQAAEQRPWVWANIDPNKTPKVTNLGKGLAFTFPLDVKNAGHLPASSVAFVTQMVAEDPPTQAARNAAVYKTCHEQREASVSGVSLFPDQSISYAERLAYLPEEALYFSQSGENRVRRSAMSPYLIACAVYRDPAGRPHHTPYIFIVGRWDHNVPGVHLIPTDVNELQKVKFGVWPWDWNLVDPD